MTDLTPAQVVAWLREQAAKCSEAADQIERTFGLGKQARNGPAFLEFKPTTVSVSVPSPSRIKEVMAGRSLRAQSIAEALGVSAETLAPVLTEENGFVRGERGWITVKEEASAP